MIIIEKDRLRKENALIKYGAEDTLKKLLPVLDTFERAQKSISEMDDPEKIKESFDVLQNNLLKGLKKSACKKLKLSVRNLILNFMKL